MTNPHATVALQTAKAILGTDEDSDHGPGALDCPDCATWWRHVLKAENTNTERDTALNQLAQTLPQDGHPNDSCTPCDGCQTELELAMQAVVLGASGLDPEQAWGEAHTQDEEHEPQDAKNCLICQENQNQHRLLHKTVTEAGYNADRFLGPLEN